MTEENVGDTNIESNSTYLLPVPSLTLSTDLTPLNLSLEDQQLIFSPPFETEFDNSRNGGKQDMNKQKNMKDKQLNKLTQSTRDILIVICTIAILGILVILIWKLIQYLLKQKQLQKEQQQTQQQQANAVAASQIQELTENMERRSTNEPIINLQRHIRSSVYETNRRQAGFQSSGQSDEHIPRRYQSENQPPIIPGIFDAGEGEPAQFFVIRVGQSGRQFGPSVISIEELAQREHQLQNLGINIGNVGYQRDQARRAESFSDDYQPDINIQRRQMIQWGLPFLQYLMRQEVIPNIQVNQQEQMKKRVEQIISELTKETYFKPQQENIINVDPCSICYEDFKMGQKLRTINYCKHHFHKDCIDEWIKCKSPAEGYPCCPLCKHELKPQIQEQSEEDANSMIVLQNQI